MLRSVRELIGYPAKALDGKVGKVSDCLIEDKQWRLRYLALSTKVSFHINLRYLSEEEDNNRHDTVLISPDHLEMPEVGRGKHTFPIQMSKTEIEHSPSIHTDAPVEMRYNWEFTHYLHHSPYERPQTWNPMNPESYAAPESNYDHEEAELLAHKEKLKEIGESHLHSIKEILGYSVMATDGKIGSLHDFVLDDKTWSIRHMVIQQGRWPVTRKILLNVKKTSLIDWSNKRIKMDLSRMDVVIAPRFNPHAAVNRDSLNRMYDYEGKPCARTASSNH